MDKFISQITEKSVEVVKTVSGASFSLVQDLKPRPNVARCSHAAYDGKLVEVPKIVFQDRIQRRTAEQIADTPALTVEQVVDVLMPQIMEQLVDVPKIVFQDQTGLPSRSLTFQPCPVWRSPSSRFSPRTGLNWEGLSRKCQRWCFGPETGGMAKMEGGRVKLAVEGAFTVAKSGCGNPDMVADCWSAVSWRLISSVACRDRVRGSRVGVERAGDLARYKSSRWMC